MYVLTNPGQFFSESVDQYTLSHAALVVLITGVLLSSSSFVITSSASANINVNVVMFAYVGTVIAAFITLVTIVLTWLLMSGAFFLISSRFDGRGEFRDLLTYVGWGYAATALSALLILFGIYLVTEQVAPPSSIEHVAQYRTQLQTHQTYVLTKVSAVGFELWRGLIWVYAVRHARNLSFKEATLTVVGPVGLSAAWSVYTIVRLL